MSVMVGEVGFWFFDLDTLIYTQPNADWAFLFLPGTSVWGGGFIGFLFVAPTPLTIRLPKLHTLTYKLFATPRHNLIDTITSFVVIMTAYCSNYQQKSKFLKPDK